MNSIEGFIEFCEGNQSNESEKEFIQLFSSDSEFRDSIKKYILLSSSLRTRAEQFAPSPELKSKVFSQIGFQAPVAVAKKSIIMDFFSGKTFPMLLSSLLTFLLTFSLMWYFDNEPRESGKFANSYSGGAHFSEWYKSSKKENIDYLRSGNTLATRASIAQEQPSSLNENSERKLPVSSAETEQLEIIPIPEIYENIFADYGKEILADNMNKLESSDLIPNRRSEVKIDTVFFLVRRAEDKFRFEFKNTPSWFSDEPRIQPLRPNRFINLSLSAFYPLFDAFVVGVEYRHENFHVKYSGKNDKDQTVNYEQQPNLQSFSLVGRYLPFELSSYLKPQLQISAGANTTGLILREMLGFEFYPFNNFYLSIGAEYNHYFFTHQNSWFNSNKFSLLYGLGVKF